jgi:SAM-dependent methyltransferase
LTEQRRPLTAIAQDAWRPQLSPGAWALDATAGTGRDTAFIAQQTQPGGHTFCIDIQPLALRQTLARLQAIHLEHAVTLIEGDHAHIAHLLPCKLQSRLALACFNLGYLPGGDHGLTTTADGTLRALRETLPFLAPGAILSVMAYRGHENALAEAVAVEGFFNTLPTPWQLCERIATGSAAHPGPVLHLARRMD